MGYLQKKRLLHRITEKVLVLFCLVFFLFFSQPLFAHAQDYKVTLIARNMTIAKVFKEIQKQTGLYAFYNNDLLNDKDVVNLSVNNMELDKVMKLILKGKGLTFNISNSNIIISRDRSAASVPGISSAAPPIADSVPTKKVTGKVTSAEDNSPLAFASVTILHTKRGTNTNAQGEFSLDVKPTDTLLVSYAGKASKKIAVNHQAYFNITLGISDDNMSPEVVVTGFQKIDKRKFTGSSAKVTMDEIKQEGVMDVSRMLEGKVAGVSVENVSGTFGAAPRIHIRGATSIGGSNKPLWVVDGIVLEDIVNVTNDQLASGDPTTMLGSSVAGINTNDIETFDILRDGSATALYGARAMNGVIVITTKKGKAGKPQMNYSGTFGSVLRPNYNKFDIMNSAQQMSVDMELGGNNFTTSEGKGWLNYSDISQSPVAGVFGKVADLVSTYDPATGKYGLANDRDSISEFLRRYALANTDWFKILFRNSFTQEHNLSMSFGTDKSQSYFSTNFYQDKGWSIGDHVNRYTANFHNTYTPNQRTTIGFLLNGSYRQQVAPGTVDRVANNVSGGYDRDFDINPFSYALNTSRAMTAYDENGNLEYFRKNFAPFNIINELKNNSLNVDVMDVKLQGELGYKFTRNLRFDFTGALRYVGSTLEHEINENSNMAEAYRATGPSYVKDNNKFLYHDPENPDADPVVVLPKGGFYNRTDNKMLNWSIRNMLTYTKDFNRNNSLNAFIGMEIKATNRQYTNFTGEGMQYNTGMTPLVDYRILKQMLEANFNYYGLTNAYDRSASAFANASYSYKKKYTLTGTLRDDASNNIKKSLPTWSISGLWNAYNEPFLNKFLLEHEVNRLSLRGSYSLSADFGPANTSSVVLQPQITKRPSLNDQETGLNLVSVANNDLTWEKKYEGDIGLDAGLFRDRLTLTVDAYKRDNFDLISMVQTAGVGGQMYKPANYADVKGHGIEVSLGGRIIQGRAFTWKTTATFAYNTNKITRMRNETMISSLVSSSGGATVGYPVRALFSLPFKQLDPQTGIPIFSNAIESQDPNVLLQGTNAGALKYEGSVDPLYTGGLTNVFTYKNFSLNILFVYQAGNKLRLASVFSPRYSDLNAMPTDFINRWEVPGDELKTNIPSISDQRMIYFLNTSSPYSNYNYSDLRVAKGGFVRLKTAALTYLLPDRMIKSAGLNTASLTFTGNNLWLMFADKKLKGQDPEFVNAGGVGSPVYTQLSLALKIGF